MVEHTQVGSFFIHDSLFHDEGGLEIIQKIMGECIIVSCIHNYGYGRFEYKQAACTYGKSTAGYSGIPRQRGRMPRRSQRLNHQRRLRSLEQLRRCQ